MARGLPWWMKPLIGSFVAILGLFLFVMWLALQVSAKGCVIDFKLDRPILPFPAGQSPDLEVAPGAPGHLASLGVGRQLHYRDTDRGKTWIAVEAWFDGEPCRVAIAGYDGPPSLSPATLRPLDPLLPMLVVRTGDAEPVWWVGEATDSPHGPNRPENGELNLLVLPGKLSLWTGDGPRYEIEVLWNETVWCTLGPKGLVVETREKRR